MKAEPADPPNTEAVTAGLPSPLYRERPTLSESYVGYPTNGPRARSLANCETVG
jgi:hypothetical protein